MERVHLLGISWGLTLASYVSKESSVSSSLLRLLARLGMKGVFVPSSPTFRAHG